VKLVSSEVSEGCYNWWGSTIVSWDLQLEYGV